MMMKQVKSLLCIIGLGCAMIITGCYSLIPSTNAPMDIITSQAQCNERADTLLVLLPGAYDKPQDFIDRGFVNAVRGRQLNVDIKLVNAHLGYYKEINVIERLREDVIKPAQQQGYQHIWLAGISLGGYGSLIYARAHASDVKGLFVMAPYLGTRDVHAEIRSAGSIAAWQPAPVKAADYDRKLWQWLQGYARQEERPRLLLGYGLSDRFADSNSLLGTALPKANVLTTEGGHDWAPWQRLWAAFLDTQPFKKVPAVHAASCIK